MLIYSLIYWRSFKLGITDAIYTSALIQTLNGKGSLQILTNEQKWLVSSQSILAYFITSGLLIISFSWANSK
jgi:hypothetical protein